MRSELWSPYLKRDIECLEKVQRRAAKLVKSFKRLSYEDRLAKLSMTILVDIRAKGDMIEVTGKDKVQVKDVFVSVRPTITSDDTATSYKLQVYQFCY